MTVDLEPGHRRPEGADRPEPPEPVPPRPSRTPGGRDGRDADTDDPTRIAWLVSGAAAIAAGTALGWDPSALAAVVTPPPLIRAALVGGSVAFGIVLLIAALGRLADDPPEAALPRTSAERLIRRCRTEAEVRPDPGRERRLEERRRKRRPRGLCERLGR